MDDASQRDLGHESPERGCRLNHSGALRWPHPEQIPWAYYMAGPGLLPLRSDSVPVRDPAGKRGMECGDYRGRTDSQVPALPLRGLVIQIREAPVLPCAGQDALREG